MSNGPIPFREPILRVAGSSAGYCRLCADTIHKGEAVIDLRHAGMRGMRTYVHPKCLSIMMPKLQDCLNRALSAHEQVRAQREAQQADENET